MKTKQIIGLTVLLSAVFLLAGCEKKEQLSEVFDAANVKEEAKQVIELINSNDYDTLANEKWNTALKAQLPAEAMRSSIKPLVDELGTFDSITNEAVTGQQDKDTDQEFAVAVIIAKYEKRKAQYTISFDTDMKVAGVYIK